ncbi:NAD dependent epimerase/dehydratase [Phaeosphaeriaceae sp. SRC1lsM3a]|nr:NAD dependent epimerase/dehydratase [Stagonospora sp. SRC1lsM3a]
MSTPQVLLTGGTGHIGFRTLREALEQGYTVRAVVRSSEKAESIRNNPALKHITGLDSKLSFVVIPDLLAPDAFDEPLNGIEYIIHIASPLIGTVSGDLEEGFVKPAVQGTLSVLNSAKKVGGVKKVVITSSAVAIVPTGVLVGLQKGDKIYTADDRANDIPAPFANDRVAYVASKIAALKAAEAWVEKEKPDFELIHIHPSYVGGRNDQTRSLGDFVYGTNGYFLSTVLGQSSTEPRLATYVHVDDVAKAHVGSLSPSITGNQSFILSNAGGEATWDDAKNIVASHFPNAVKEGLLPNNGSQPGGVVKIDIKKTEDAFGKLKGFETIIVSIAEHYLELRQN